MRGNRFLSVPSNKMEQITWTLCRVFVDKVLKRLVAAENRSNYPQKYPGLTPDYRHRRRIFSFMHQYLNDQHCSHLECTNKPWPASTTVITMPATIHKPFINGTANPGTTIAVVEVILDSSWNITRDQYWRIQLWCLCKNIRRGGNTQESLWLIWLDILINVLLLLNVLESCTQFARWTPLISQAGREACFFFLEISVLWPAWDQVVRFT